jgi:hypothetical protein
LATSFVFDFEIKWEEFEVIQSGEMEREER